MAPHRATRRRRVQTGTVPRGTGPHRQPVPGVVPTRPVDAGGRGEYPSRERDQPRARPGERPGASAQGVRRVAAPRFARHADPENPLHDDAGEGAGAAAQAERRHFTELPLPASDKEYRIVSRQDTSALETPPDHDGKISGHAVKIADPAKFWANSKYLIIVEG